jgi:type VI secretion system protein ImpG
MNREFLELYNRELRILKENAKDFAEDFPGVADRLGGLLENSTDPMIEGLLQGTAFLASRVQLKLKHEYEQFTSNLLEQLLPDYLAPTPATALLKFEPPFTDPGLKDGVLIETGSYVEARFVERQRRIACKFRLAGDTMLWPFELASAEYLPSQAALHGLGIDASESVQAGLRISLLRRTVARREDEPKEKQVAKKPESWISSCRADELTFYITCAEIDAVRIYEKIFAHGTAIYLRNLNELGDAVITPLPIECLQQVGFDDKEALFPRENRMFSGFELLREFFTLPTKFLAFRISGLSAALRRMNTNKFDLVVAIDQADSRLVPVIRPEAFSLYAVPAANVFEMATARVIVKPSEHEYHIVTDRSRHLDFEVIRVLKANAHYAGSSDKRDIHPLYAGPPLGASETGTIYYTLRRLPRRRSQDEHRFGQASAYVGTDTYLTLTNHDSQEGGLRVSEVSLRALCSNRHLTEHLPVGQGGADFILEDKTNLNVSCVNGPTPPRDAVCMTTNSSGGNDQHGTAAWRLINMISLNHLGLTSRGTADSSNALREMLSLFANLTDAATEQRIRGIKAVESRPINRRIRQQNGTGVVRGLEIRVTFDENNFEGSGIFLLGAILDRFFAEYAGINSVVQTVVVSAERGPIMRWPVRMGKKVEL